jgi:hypothetical protein
MASLLGSGLQLGNLTNKGGNPIGGIDPFQAAATQFTLGENIDAIKNRYAQLGLGQSTMETQDVSGANLGALAQAAGFEQQNVSNQLAANAQNAQLAQGLNTSLQSALSNAGNVAGLSGASTFGTGASSLFG